MWAQSVEVRTIFSFSFASLSLAKAKTDKNEISTNMFYSERVLTLLIYVGIDKQPHHLLFRCQF
jgi:hypothetical protein